MNSLQIRYAKSFLIDLQRLKPEAKQRIEKYVFTRFESVTQLPDLPKLRPIGTAGLLYRFTIDDYLIGIEIQGQIIKFLRVMRIPVF